MKTITIETSARHIHLTQEHVEALFGAGHTLTKKKDLSQPGEFACEERVTVKGPKKEIKNVIVLGPTRANTQIEVALTDGRSLGLDVPVRLSGEVDGTPGCTLVGPAGELEIDKGVIAAKRHIHLTQADAEKLNVKDKQVVCVKVNSQARTLILDDTVVRVNNNFAPYMHIDTDEANAAGISGNIEGEIVEIEYK